MISVRTLDLADPLCPLGGRGSGEREKHYYTDTTTAGTRGSHYSTPPEYCGAGHRRVLELYYGFSTTLDDAHAQNYRKRMSHLAVRDRCPRTFQVKDPRCASLR